MSPAKTYITTMDRNKVKTFEDVEKRLNLYQYNTEFLMENFGNMFTRFDRVEDKLVQHDRHLVDIESVLEEHSERFEKIESVLEEYSEHFEKIESILAIHSEKFEKFEQRLDTIEKRMDSLDRSVNLVIELLHQLIILQKK